MPNGQIQPQNTRPNTSVSPSTTSDQASPRYTVCVLSSVIAPTNGSASKKPSTGKGKRTGSFEVAVNVPRNAVAHRKYKNSPMKPTCDTRRTQTKIRITLRAGKPEPARLGPLVFFGLAGAVVAIGALGPPLFAVVADAATLTGLTARAGFAGELARRI